tara:strand:+ start:416 stop:661 length:246 start_codon:yes stop_codon:yes gene_type:complete
MYTVEFEHDITIVTSIDEEAEHEDLEVVLDGEGIVYMRQYDDSLRSYQLVVISYQQLLDVITSLNQTEGMFMLELLKGIRR